MSVSDRVYVAGTQIHGNTAKVFMSLRDPQTGDAVADPLAGVDRMTCELLDAGVTVDTKDSPNAITWEDDGTILINMSQHNFNGEIPTGKQDCKLVAYDPTHPTGQVISHPDGDNIRLELTFIK